MSWYDSGFCRRCQCCGEWTPIMPYTVYCWDCLWWMQVLEIAPVRLPSAGSDSGVLHRGCRDTSREISASPCTPALNRKAYSSMTREEALQHIVGVFDRCEAEFGASIDGMGSPDVWMREILLALGCQSQEIDVACRACH